MEPRANRSLSKSFASSPIKVQIFMYVGTLIVRAELHYAISFLCFMRFRIGGVTLLFICEASIPRDTEPTPFHNHTYIPLTF